MIAASNLDGYFTNNLLLISLALALEWRFGGIGQLLQRGYHPIAALGWLIARVAAITNPQHINRKSNQWSSSQGYPHRQTVERLAGIAALCLVLLVTGFVTLLLLQIIDLVLDKSVQWLSAPGADNRSIIGYLTLTAQVMLAAPLLAGKLLADRVARVAQALASPTSSATAAQLPLARRELRHLVGRETGKLSAGQVNIAAIESLIENFNDAVIAPAFYTIIAGLPGLALYKAINTLDSCWGYRSREFQWFGWAAARCDDLANYLPARLAVLILIMGYWLWYCFGKLVRRLPGTEQQRTLANRPGRRNIISLLIEITNNSQRHQSPNAGMLEATVSALLKIRLGGPRSYPDAHKPIKSYWLGEAYAEPTVADIALAVTLYRHAYAVIMIALLFALFVRVVVFTG